MAGNIEPLPLPGFLEHLYEGWDSSVAWSFIRGRTVHRLESISGEVHFAKLMASDLTPRLADEARRVRWLAAYLPVPRIIANGEESGVDWLLTEGLPGQAASAPERLAHPEVIVRVFAKGLRALHDRVYADACPFDSRPQAVIPELRRRISDGLIDQVGRFHTKFAGMSVAEALEFLETSRPDDEDLVVCHGDYCFPNVLVQDERVSAYLDLGRLGIADRWWDLSIASWSVGRNVGTEYEQILFDAYGVAPDQSKRDYFCLLDDLMS